jgi:catechol 2,3-dioxygenase-like lactoylglutathione lyase family enzyme
MVNLRPVRFSALEGPSLAAMTVELKRLNHVGLTVTNLERSLDFYRRAFGQEAVIRGVGGGPEVAKSVGLEEALISYAFVDFGNTRMELLEYERPDGRRQYDLRTCDTGAVHVCFEVDDVMSAHEAMKAEGIEFLSDPIVLDNTHGVLSGLAYVYFRDPDGVTLQLYQLPAG